MHPFEKAGLGQAPFRVVKVTREVGPIKYPNGVEVGYPGQPMGTCAYCSTGIAECWHIRSSDGKTFKVGCECVRKTEDVQLLTDMKPHLRKKRREATRRANDKAVLNAELLQSALAEGGDVELQARLAELPHPIIPGKTLLGWAQYVLKFGGTSGKKRVLVCVKKLTSKVGA